MFGDLDRRLRALAARRQEDDSDGESDDIIEVPCPHIRRRPTEFIDLTISDEEGNENLVPYIDVVDGVIQTPSARKPNKRITPLQEKPVPRNGEDFGGLPARPAPKRLGPRHPAFSVPPITPPRPVTRATKRKSADSDLSGSSSNSSEPSSSNKVRALARVLSDHC